MMNSPQHREVKVTVTEHATEITDVQLGVLQAALNVELHASSTGGRSELGNLEDIEQIIEQVFGNLQNEATAFSQPASEPRSPISIPRGNSF